MNIGSLIQFPSRDKLTRVVRIRVGRLTKKLIGEVKKIILNIEKTKIYSIFGYKVCLITLFEGTY